MKTNKEILDEFGKKIIESGFDPSIGNLISLRNKENPPMIFEQYVNLFKKLNENEFNILKQYLKESLGDLLFNFLKVFEENPHFKLYYEKDNQKINLVEISEMLKAEPIIEGGWIERFSKQLKND